MLVRSPADLRPAQLLVRGPGSNLLGRGHDRGSRERGEDALDLDTRAVPCRILENEERDTGVEEHSPGLMAADGRGVDRWIPRSNPIKSSPA